MASGLCLPNVARGPQGAAGRAASAAAPAAAPAATLVVAPAAASVAAPVAAVVTAPAAATADCTVTFIDGAFHDLFWAPTWADEQFDEFMSISGFQTALPPTHLPASPIAAAPIPTAAPRPSRPSPPLTTTATASAPVAPTRRTSSGAAAARSERVRNKPRSAPTAVARRGEPASSGSLSPASSPEALLAREMKKAADSGRARRQPSSTAASTLANAKVDVLAECGAMAPRFGQEELFVLLIPITEGWSAVGCPWAGSSSEEPLNAAMRALPARRGEQFKEVPLEVWLRASLMFHGCRKERSVHKKTPMDLWALDITRARGKYLNDRKRRAERKAGTVEHSPRAPQVSAVPGITEGMPIVEACEMLRVRVMPHHADLAQAVALSVGADAARPAPEYVDLTSDFSSPEVPTGFGHGRNLPQACAPRDLSGHMTDTPILSAILDNGVSKAFSPEPAPWVPESDEIQWFRDLVADDPSLFTS